MAMIKNDSDDEAFVEEECTMDFADDDRVAEPRTGQHQHQHHQPHRLQNGKSQGYGQAQNQIMFREYGGEDFSQYLNDDDEDMVVFPPHPLQEENAYVEPRNGDRPPPVPGATPAGPRGEIAYRNRPQDVIKERVNKWLNTVRQRTRRYDGYDDIEYNARRRDSTAAGSTRMSEFTYAHSKIGTMEDEEGCSPPPHAGGPGSDSGIDTLRGPHSDLGYTGHREMLGEGRTSGYTPVGDTATRRRRKSRSSSNLAAESDLGTESGRGSGEKSGGSGSNKRLSNVWQKLSNSLSRKPKLRNSEGYDNGTTSHANNLSYGNEYEDIHL